MNSNRQGHLQILALAVGLCIAVMLNHRDLHQRQALGKPLRQQNVIAPMVEAKRLSIASE